MNKHSTRLLTSLENNIDSYRKGETTLLNLASAALSIANALDEPSLAKIRVELEKFEATIELLTSSIGEDEGDTLVQRTVKNLHQAITRQLGNP